VDKADSTIKFHCENCGRKFSVPQIHAGKKCKCPKCKNIIVVPKIQTTRSVTEQNNSEDTKTSSKSSVDDSALLVTPQKDKIQDLPLGQPENSEKTAEYDQELEEESAEKTKPASSAQRRLPWPIDIFLYPLSISGLIHLVIFLCVPILISVAYQLLLQQIYPVSELILVVLYVLFAGYVLYYLSWCIIDSTKGGLRAPDINFQPSPAKGEMIECVGIFLACVVVCFWPTAVYYIFTRKTDLLYWLLNATGLLFFPMALLAGFLNDSISGLKPMLIVKSIIKTFPGYLPVVIFFAGFFAVLSIVIPPPQQSKGLEPILLYLSQVTSAIFSSRNALRSTGFIYLAMTGAHILGRFYCKYQEKLNWEV
jgi:DNA-directed RNA polymerase subunit RPC12/RpoP